MATSSIFASFDITEKKKARSFVRALEKSAKTIGTSRRTKKTLVSDKKQIKAVFQGL